MKKTTIAKDEPFDNGLSFVITQIKKAVLENDDDFLLLIVGDTGSGKSHLMMHIYNAICGSSATHENICFNIEDFFKIAKKVGVSRRPRFFSYDEAAISKRASLSTLNRDLINYYMACRGQNICHVWCTPSADMVDKFFLKERIKGLIFIADKRNHKPRRYYYYTKKDLIRLMDKRGDLTQYTLKRNARNYAYFMGGFRKYEGALLDDYNKRKDDRMRKVTDDLFEKYVGSDGYSRKTRDIMLLLNVTTNTVRTYAKELEQKGLLIEDVNFIRKPTGHTLYNDDALVVFKENYGKKRKRKLK